MRPSYAALALCLAAPVLADAHSGSPPEHGPAQFAMLQSLEGEWRAPLDHGTMIDVFRPIGRGSAVLHEEWLDGKQLTATVFYLVGPVLHADHFCDLKNQLRYVAEPADDARVVRFRLQDAQNLDVFPRHFHSTTWQLRDAAHLTQDWQIVEHGKEVRVVRMDFTRVDARVK